MPTDFDWKTWKKRQHEPEPPPLPEEPKFIKVLSIIANLVFGITMALILFTWWVYSNDAEYSNKVIYKCQEQKGVAVRTVRGDTVCIREDALTEVLGKTTNHVK